MDPRREKVIGTSKKVGAAAPRGSAQSSRRRLERPPASSAASGTAQSSSGKCNSPGKSESLRKKGDWNPPETPQVCASGARARAQKAPRRPGDSQPSGAASADHLEGQQAITVPIEGPVPSAAAELPFPRVGSRCERGSRSQGEETAGSGRARRSGSGPVELPSPARQLQTRRLGRRESAPGGWKPREVLEKLRLSRPDIIPAAEVVNKVVDHLLRRLQRGDSEFQGISLLRTGSYYERVKISAPNEFDVMFKLNIQRIHLEEYCSSGAYYFVKFKRNPKGNPLSQFLKEEILSASKMLDKFRKIIKEEITNIDDTEVVLKRKKRGSPAVTLLIRKPKEISVDLILALESNSNWPISTKEGLPIDNWLGTKVRTKLRRQPYYLVPKNAKEGKGFQEETWRLSFSHIEKDILINHGQSKTCCEKGGEKCCRKECLKLMKFLLEQLKKKFINREEMNKFCSYHVKTAFFRICTQEPDDNKWLAKDLVQCFDNCVEYFLQCLRTEQLKHYFIPGFNLFSSEEIGKVNKDFLFKQIEYERNNGFPVFNEL
ncbi:cyclic GMP-AMP synthase [Rhynchocyon petersi]